jgi:hypothetical protein
MLKWAFRCCKSLYSNTLLQARNPRLQKFTPKTYPTNGLGPMAAHIYRGEGRAMWPNCPVGAPRQRLQPARCTIGQWGYGNGGGQQEPSVGTTRENRVRTMESSDLC